jgi:Prealbumin-like fold domain
MGRDQEKLDASAARTAPQRLAYSMVLRTLAVFFFAVICLNAASADTLNWNYPAANFNLLTGTSSTTVNGVTIQTNAAAAGTYDSNNSTILRNGQANGLSGAGVIQMQMDSTTDNGTSNQATTITFSEPVYNLQFTVWDIDGGPNCTCQFNDIVQFSSNAGVPTSFSIPVGGSVIYNSGTGIATTDNQGVTDASGNITVTFAGPVTTLTVRHTAGDATGTTNSTNQFVYIDDLTYLRSPRLAVTKGYSPAGAATTFNFDVSNSGAGTTATSVTTSGAAVTGTQIRLNVLAATTVTETGPAGWIMSGANAACTDSNSAASGNPASFNAPIAGSGLAFTVPVGNIRAGAVIACAITDVSAPRLTLLKSVVNDNGGTNADGDFTLTAAGPTNITGIEGAASVTAAAVNAGAYLLTESGAATANYTQISWTCTGTGTFTAPNQIALGSGQSASCTVTNNDKPKLTLQKSVINNSGGSAA